MMIKDGKPGDAAGPLTGPIPAAMRGTDRVMAQRQRGWELGLPAYAEVHGQQPVPIIAVGGGKGGVGKSLVSANLAVRLAATGRRVLAIDLDVGGANLHTYFGLPAPTHGLADAVVFGRKSFGEIIVPTGAQGVSLVAGGNEEAWGGASGMSPAVLGRFFAALALIRERRQADLVILDLGAGTASHTLDFFTAAHLGIVTVLPEPTSIENAYLFLKTTLFRLIANVGDQLALPTVAAAVRELLLQPGATGKARGLGYADKLREAAAAYPAFISHLSTALQARTIGIAVNQVRSQKDIDVGKSMELIGERYFGFRTRSCGYLNYDEAAWKSLRNRRLLVVDFPHSVLSKRFTELARVVLNDLSS